LRFSDELHLTTSKVILRSEEIIGIGSGFFFELVSDEIVHGNMQLLIFSRHILKERVFDVSFGLHYDRMETIRAVRRNGILSAQQTSPMNVMRFSYLERPEIFAHDLEYLDMTTGLSAIDVSANWDYLGGLESHVFSKVLDEDFLLSDTDPPLYIGQRVFLIGYPDVDGTNLIHNPIWKEAFIESDPARDYDGQPQFVINGQFPSGYIGSPVFVLLGDGQCKVAGILTSPSGNNASNAIVTKSSALKAFLKEIVSKEVHRFALPNNSYNYWMKV
jgi:hypothetical protein